MVDELKMAKQLAFQAIDKAAPRQQRSVIPDRCLALSAGDAIARPWTQNRAIDGSSSTTYLPGIEYRHQTATQRANLSRNVTGRALRQRSQVEALLLSYL